MDSEVSDAEAIAGAPDPATAQQIGKQSHEAHNKLIDGIGGDACAEAVRAARVQADEIWRSGGERTVGLWSGK